MLLKEMVEIVQVVWIQIFILWNLAKIHLILEVL